MKGKQVALDVDVRSHRARASTASSTDALELVELSQEDPFAGPADPELLADPSTAPDLDLFDPAGGRGRRRAGDRASRSAASRRRATFDPRITNSEGATFSAHRGRRRRSCSRAASAAATRARTSRSASSPVAEDEGGKKRRGYHWTAKRFLAELDDAEEVGREAARRTLRKLGARKVADVRGAGRLRSRRGARRILGMLAGCIMGSSIWRKSSYLVGREGTRVASDARHHRRRSARSRARPGSRPFDGEGLAEPQERGRREGRAHDLSLRQLLARASSVAPEHRRAPRAAARRAASGRDDELHPPARQPTRTTTSSKGTKRGLYVTEMMGFGFNAVTGDFSRGASRLLDRERRARVPRQRGHDLAQRRRALASASTRSATISICAPRPPRRRSASRR